MSERLTPRQKAARANRAKRPPLSEEARDRLRQAALKNRPWLHSTGPRTPEGKRRSRQNALRRWTRAYTLLPTNIKQFMGELRDAERGKGPVPVSYVAAIDLMAHGQSLALVARGSALLLRHQRLLRNVLLS